MRKVFLVFIAMWLNQSFAANPMVLDLYYDHIPNTNKYLFTVAQQVDQPSSNTQITIYSNSPAGSITANRILILPYSLSCSSPRYLQLYRSDTIDLGALPTTGYRFGITDCCRLPTLVNIANAGTSGFLIETFMAPLPGETYANSSPRFVNPPIEQQVGYIALQQPALDPDGDSVYYEFTALEEGTFTSPQAVGYVAGYSGVSPFGSNAVLSIDQQTGTWSATNANQGTYAIGLKASSYTNGVLTGFVVRDMVVRYLVPSALYPTIHLSNVYTSAGSADTTGQITQVYLQHGDTVTFDFTGTAGFIDSVYLGATSTGLFSLSLHTVGNCTGNCAQLIPNPNLYGTYTATSTFWYAADSSHFTGGDTATQRVILLAASQKGCQPFQFANRIIDINLVRPNNVGIDETAAVHSINVYPNPADDYIGINGQAGAYYQLYDAIGKQVATGRCTSNEERIPTFSLPNGIYFLVLDNTIYKVVLQ